MTCVRVTEPSHPPHRRPRGTDRADGDLGSTLVNQTIIHFIKALALNIKPWFKRDKAE